MLPIKLCHKNFAGWKISWFNLIIGTHFQVKPFENYSFSSSGMISCDIVVIGDFNINVNNNSFISFSTYAVWNVELHAKRLKRYIAIMFLKYLQKFYRLQSTCESERHLSVSQPFYSIKSTHWSVFNNEFLRTKHIMKKWYSRQNKESIYNKHIIKKDSIEILSSDEIRTFNKQIHISQKTIYFQTRIKILHGILVNCLLM